MLNNHLIGQGNSFSQYQSTQVIKQQPPQTAVQQHSPRIPQGQDNLQIKTRKSGTTAATLERISQNFSNEEIKKQNSSGKVFGAALRAAGLATLAYGVITKNSTASYVGAAVTFGATVGDSNVSTSGKALAGAAFGSAAYALLAKDSSMFLASVSLFTSSNLVELIK